MLPATSDVAPGGPPASVTPGVAEEAAPRGKRSNGEHNHHVAISFGGTFENGSDDSDSARFGLEYEHVWRKGRGPLGERWGLGAMLEIDTPPVEEVLVAVQIVHHPVPQAGLVIAPGYVFAEDEDDSTMLLRLGMVWEFELGERFSLAPELFYDIQEAGGAPRWRRSPRATESEAIPLSGVLREAILALAPRLDLHGPREPQVGFLQNPSERTARHQRPTKTAACHPRCPVTVGRNIEHRSGNVRPALCPLTPNNSPLLVIKASTSRASRAAHSELPARAS